MTTFIESQPTPRQVRDALRDALQAAYGCSLRKGAFEALGIHGNWSRWDNSFPDGVSLRHLAPDLARVGVSIDDVMLRPHVVPWRLAMQMWQPNAQPSYSESGIWLRIQHAITQRRVNTKTPAEGGRLHVRIEKGSAEAASLLYFMLSYSEALISDRDKQFPSYIVFDVK